MSRRIAKTEDNEIRVTTQVGAVVVEGVRHGSAIAVHGAIAWGSASPLRDGARPAIILLDFAMPVMDGG